MLSMLKRGERSSAKTTLLIHAVFLLRWSAFTMIFSKFNLVRAFPCRKITSYHSLSSFAEGWNRNWNDKKTSQGRLEEENRNTQLFSSSSSTYLNHDDDDENKNPNPSKSKLDSLFSDILMEDQPSSKSKEFQEVNFNYDFDEDDFEDDEDDDFNNNNYYSDDNYDDFLEQPKVREAPKKTPVTKSTVDSKKEGKRRTPPSLMEYDYSHHDDEFGEAVPGEFGAADYIPPEVLLNQPLENPKPKEEVVKRKIPPPLMEYDYSHYDDEFGEAIPGEFGAAEYIPPEVLANQIDEDEILQPQKIMEPSFQNKATKQKDEISRENETNVSPIPASQSPKGTKEVRTESVTNSFENRKQIDHQGPKKEEEKMKYSKRPSFTKLHTSVPSDETLEFLRAAANGIPSQTMSTLPMQEKKMEKIKEEIFALHKNKKFNINSPRQVSKALFGVEGESTDKYTLEALAATSTNVENVNKARMASLILQYRQINRDIKRLQSNQKKNSVNYRPKAVRSGTVNNNPEYATQNRNPLLLLDASAFIFRSYYSMPPLHTSDGTPVGAVLGFCNTINRLILNKLLNGERPRLALVYDSKTGSSHRKNMYEKYKANRKPCPIDLVPQFDLIKEASSAYGITQLECENWEADDVIATLATKAAYEEGCHVNILSGDKDLMQLITSDDSIEGNGNNKEQVGSIHMIDPMNSARITHSEVIDKWGVPPHKLGDVLALAGDSSDNIPGVPGIGPKIASKLINEFGSLESLLAPSGLEQIPQKGRRMKLEENIDLARLSRQLVELERRIPLESMTVSSPFDNVSDIYVDNFNSDRLIDFYDRMGFRDLKRKLQSRLSQQQRSPKQPTTFVEEKLSFRGNSFPSPKKQAPPMTDDLDEIPF